MELNDLPDHFAAELDFPVEKETAREAVGDVEVEAPDADHSVPVESLLEDLGEDSYESADMLYQTLSGQLPDEFIGRKFYDDRGPNVEHDESPKDGGDESF
ncbi:hypothetical protein L593_06985 [Salinarchaeum sp. Harcht-Bsk1]|uniref:DUF5789 family protein n=1 Tax=Salinarchaeum sp. Harcht-Bsk1 TaxID=1333523 RepID=UPI00034242D5|nr:hypothetical protein [Salinarchaeum sp. Harcht-Bsk1]AGN01344.1 hypothetical protein L593_06985 [Salinarchaeum sp. Harcht-Bsk1]